MKYDLRRDYKTVVDKAKYTRHYVAYIFLQMSWRDYTRQGYIKRLYRIRPEFPCVFGHPVVQTGIADGGKPCGTFSIIDFEIDTFKNTGSIMILKTELIKVLEVSNRTR